MNSEFEGKRGKSGIAKKPQSALSASEKLRLISTTGGLDPDVKPSKWSWEGQVKK